MNKTLVKCHLTLYSEQTIVSGKFVLKLGKRRGKLKYCQISVLKFKGKTWSGHPDISLPSLFKMHSAEREGREVDLEIRSTETEA